MARNLRSRLAVIRSHAAPPEPPKRSQILPPEKTAGLRGWKEAGFQTAHRTLNVPLKMSAPGTLHGDIALILPDLKTGDITPDNLLFFDLETTGLSRGAGTVAFLAAFGRFARQQNNPAFVLAIDQFLLLDYPGEADFLDAVLRYMRGRADEQGGKLVLTSYNGKCFDSQILKTRCLINGHEPPSFPQLDLLYPSRRMWKRVLPNCSQATVETMILGLDRSGDIPGSLAPEIWFDFLRSNGTAASLQRLLGICDHNVNDIAGLAALFSAFAGIAEDPAAETFRCDKERLAMIWRRRARNRPDKAGFERTAGKLLEAAAEEYPHACLRLGFDLFRKGAYEKGRAALEKLRTWPEPIGCPPALKAMALRALAIDAEKRLGQRERARACVAEALALAKLPESLRASLQKRRERLSALNIRELALPAEDGPARVPPEERRKSPR